MNQAGQPPPIPKVLRFGLQQIYLLYQKISASVLRTKDEAIAKLINMSELTRQQDKMSELVNISKLRELFNEIPDKFAGQQETLDFMCGQWLQLMRGKKVLPSIIHHCFKVTDARGKLLQGPKKLTAVIKVLVRQPLEQQPEDFQRLPNLRWRKIKQSA